MSREHWPIRETPYASYREYLACTGKNAVLDARRTDAGAILEEIQRSGLRSRGGAGFPVGVMWKTIRDHPCNVRFVVCNAAEGEPGTFKDRWLLCRNPYSLLEGMLIAHVFETRTLYIGIEASFHAQQNPDWTFRSALGDAAVLSRTVP